MRYKGKQNGRPSLFPLLSLLLLLLCNVYMETAVEYTVGVRAKLCFAAAFFVLWTWVCYHPSARFPARRWAQGLFVYYLWVLVNVLFFDTSFGRMRSLSEYGHFYAIGVNLTPFETVRRYLRSYQKGTVAVRHILLNLVGNVVAFAPMGVFLPALFRRQRKIGVFLCTVLLLVSAVEVTQLLTGTGSLDIDDLILNTGGALLIYLFCRLPFVKKKMESLIDG